MKLKKLFSLLIALAMAAVLTAAGQQHVRDEANVLTPGSVAIVNDKDMHYRQHSVKPQVYLTTQKGLSIKKPAVGDKDLAIIVGVSGQKRNVRLFPGRDLEKTLTKERCDNLVLSQLKSLRAKKNFDFNQGLQKVIAGACTLIEHRYGFPADAYSLKTGELKHLLSPHSVKLPIALGIAVVVMVAFTYLERKKLSLKK